MSLNPLASVCRSCRFYTPEGRRGGQCQQLGVPVRSSWHACALAIPAFAPSWETLEAIAIWPTDDQLVSREKLQSDLRKKVSTIAGSPASSSSAH